MKAYTDQEKKMNKFSQVNEKFSKTSEKLVETEALKKRYAERCKEYEKENKDLLKETMLLRERNEKLSKENAELRTSRVTNERSLIDKIKRTEGELCRARQELDALRSEKGEPGFKVVQPYNAKVESKTDPSGKIDKNDWRFDEEQEDLHEMDDGIEDWNAFERKIATTTKAK